MPTLWSYYAKDGEQGLSLRIMYAKTASPEVIPPVQKTQENPGSD